MNRKADEDAADIAAVREQFAFVARQGRDASVSEVLPEVLTMRLLAGESPVSVWREHRSMTLSALASEAGVSVAYLSEIETGKKSGSAAAMARLAQVLSVHVEQLATRVEG
ncbi:helix-turn-helix domain-containing protein [Roseomonas elaeocarpi]|uniref:Helix-turn-helix domain-containing protein n=1 Tax=Roseomonas elaeocarpi TaxID=907779 RepID=A0ABV6JZU5_9PROT